MGRGTDVQVGTRASCVAASGAAPCALDAARASFPCRSDGRRVHGRAAARGRDRRSGSSPTGIGAADRPTSVKDGRSAGSPAASAAVEAQPAPSECVVSEASDKVTVKGEFNVRVVKVKLEGGVEYVRQTRANGQVAITVKLPTSGGVGTAAGEGAEDGSGKLDGVGQGRADSAGHVRPARRQGRRQVRAAGHGLGDRDRRRRRSARAWYGKKRPHRRARRSSRSPTSCTGGGNVVDRTSTRPGGYANGSIDLGQALGIKKNLTERQAELRRHHGLLHASTASSAGEGRPDSSGPSAPAARWPATRRWRHVRLRRQAEGADADRLSRAATRASSSSAGQVQGPPDGARRGRRARHQGRSQGEGQKIQFQLDLPLDNPQVQDATLAFLRGINPVTGGPADTAAAAARAQGARSCRTPKRQIRTLRHQLDITPGGNGRPRRRRRRRRPIDTNAADLTGALDYVPGEGFVPSAGVQVNEAARRCSCCWRWSSSPAVAATARRPSRPPSRRASRPSTGDGWTLAYPSRLGRSTRSTAAWLAQGPKGAGGLAPQAAVARDAKPPPFDVSIDGVQVRPDSTAARQLEDHARRGVRARRRRGGAGDRGATTSRRPATARPRCSTIDLLVRTRRAARSWTS